MLSSLSAFTLVMSSMVGAVPTSHTWVYTGTGGYGVGVPGFVYAGDWWPDVDVGARFIPGDFMGTHGIAVPGNEGVVTMSLANGDGFAEMLISRQDANGAWHNVLFFDRCTPGPWSFGCPPSRYHEQEVLPGIDLGDQVQVGDLDGDGLADILAPRADSRGAWHNDVYLSNGPGISYAQPGFTSAGDWWPNVGGPRSRYLLGDFAGAHYEAVGAETGVAFEQRYGDGRADLLVSTPDATGRWRNLLYYGREACWPRAWGCPAVGYRENVVEVLPGVDLGPSVQVGDLDGDGLSDLLVPRVDAAGARHNDVYLCAGPGAGFVYAGDWWPGVGGPTGKVVLGDFSGARMVPAGTDYGGVTMVPANGDRRADLLASTQDAAGNWRNVLYHGRTACTPYAWGCPAAGYRESVTEVLPGVDLGAKYSVGDFNQDGIADIAVWVPPPPADEYFVPAYVVQSIKYAFPGNRSTMRYEAGSTVGATWETSRTIGNTLKVSWDPQLYGFTAGTDLKLSQTNTTRTALQSSANGSQTLSSLADEPSHLNDVFTIWINPLLRKHSDYDVATGKLAPDQYFFSAVYQLWIPPGVDPSLPVLRDFSVAELVNPASASDGYKRAFLGQLSPADISSILKLNPFINPDGTVNPYPTLDRNRFRPVQTDSTGGVVPACGISFSSVSSLNKLDCVAKYSYSRDDTTKFQADWTVRVGLKILGGKVGASNDFNLSYSRSHTESTSWSTSASLHLETSTPGVCVTGQLLTDTMFNTFIVPSFTLPCP